MNPIKARKSRAAHYTPPPNLKRTDDQKQLKTPQRCSVFWAKVFGEALGIKIDQKLVHKVTGAVSRNQTRILASREIRTVYNQEGVDPRGRKRALTRSDTAAIGRYLDDETVPLRDRGRPWINVAQNAGVDLPNTIHFKPPGTRIVNPEAI